MLLALLSLFWGLAWPAMKIVLGEIRPWTFRAICLAAGGAALLALARAGGAALRVPAGDLTPLIITSLINITGWHILSAYGLTLLHAGRAVIIAYTMPLWAILLSRLLLKEHITSARWWALGIGWTGLALLLGPDMQAVGAAPLGALMMLGAAACWAAGTVLVKFFKWHMPGTLVMGWQLLIGGIPIVVGAILIDPGHRDRHGLLEGHRRPDFRGRTADHLLPLGVFHGRADIPGQCRRTEHLGHPGDRRLQQRPDPGRARDGHRADSAFSGRIIPGAHQSGRPADRKLLSSK